MAIEERSAAWRTGQSWYVLLTLPFGLTSFLAFFYLGWRGRRPKWIVCGIVYLAAVIGIFSMPMETGPDGTEVMTDTAGGAMLALWIITLVHALVARREFLGILDARDSRPQPQSQMLAHAHAPRPAADSFDVLRGTSSEPGGRDDFALFKDVIEPRPTYTVSSTPPPIPSTPRPSASPPPLPRVPPPVPQAPPPPPQAAPFGSPAAAPPPPLTPAAPPPAVPAELPQPFSGPAPFGGRKPFGADDDDDRREPPAPPPPPRRPGRQVDY